jgi:hypothetical protein
MVKHETSFRVLGPANEFHFRNQGYAQYFKFNPRMLYIVLTLCMPALIWILKAHTVNPNQSDAPSEVFPPTKLKKFSTKIFPHYQHICYPIHMLFAYKGFSSKKHAKFATQQISSQVNTLSISNDWKISHTFNLLPTYNENIMFSVHRYQCTRPFPPRIRGTNHFLLIHEKGRKKHHMLTAVPSISTRVFYKVWCKVMEHVKSTAWINMGLNSL